MSESVKIFRSPNGQRGGSGGGGMWSYLMERKDDRGRYGKDGLEGLCGLVLGDTWLLGITWSFRQTINSFKSFGLGLSST